MDLPQHNPSKGFTLIELLVVVSVMVSLLSIGVASYNSFARVSTLEGASKGLRANLRLAQAFALNGEKITGTCASPLVFQGYYVSLNTSGSQSYSLGQWCQDPNALPITNQYTLRTPPSPILLPTGVTFSPAASTNPLTILFKSIRGIDIYSSNTCCSTLISPTPATTTINLCIGSPCSGSNIRTISINAAGAIQ